MQKLPEEKVEVSGWVEEFGPTLLEETKKDYQLLIDEEVSQRTYWGDNVYEVLLTHYKIVLGLE